MNALTKILAPIALVAAAASAQAGVLETDYPANVTAQNRAVAVDTSAAAVAGSTALQLLHSEAAFNGTAATNAAPRGRDEVRKEARSAGWSHGYNHGYDVI